MFIYAYRIRITANVAPPSPKPDTSVSSWRSFWELPSHKPTARTKSGARRPRPTTREAPARNLLSSRPHRRWTPQSHPCPQPSPPVLLHTAARVSALPCAWKQTPRSGHTAVTLRGKRRGVRVWAAPRPRPHSGGRQWCRSPRDRQAAWCRARPQAAWRHQRRSARRTSARVHPAPSFR